MCLHLAIKNNKKTTTENVYHFVFTKRQYTTSALVNKQTNTLLVSLWTFFRAMLPLLIDAIMLDIGSTAVKAQKKRANRNRLSQIIDDIKDLNGSMV